MNQAASTHSSGDRQRKGCEMWESRGWIRCRPHTLVKQDTSSLLVFSNSYIIVFSGSLPPFNHTVFSLSSSLFQHIYSSFIIHSSMWFSLCCKFNTRLSSSLPICLTFLLFLYYRCCTVGVDTLFSSVLNTCSCHLITSDSIHPFIC